MKQKFMRGTFVHITDDMPIHMRFFTSDVDAIVDGTYAQLCGGCGDDFKDYSLYLIGSDGKVYSKIAWYDEEQLTALSKQDFTKAEQMVEDYLIDLYSSDEEEDDS